jgi:hypothetical protein
MKKYKVTFLETTGFVRALNVEINQNYDFGIVLNILPYNAIILKIELNTNVEADN